ncbi:MAG: hypothetical protein EBV77_11210 [Gemmatimonadaceae bacterium]|nr:hypothetical protein [Gemmatimonadaceae bacterium]
MILEYMILLFKNHKLKHFIMVLILLQLQHHYYMIEHQKVRKILIVQIMHYYLLKVLLLFSQKVQVYFQFLTLQ